jgi:hypothetical protein
MTQKDPYRDNPFEKEAFQMTELNSYDD